MKIVFSLKHKNVLESPGVFTDVVINCGLECHNDQDPVFALGQVKLLAPWVATTWLSGLR